MKVPACTIRFDLPLRDEGIEALRQSIILRVVQPKMRALLARHYLHPDLFTNEDEAGNAYDRYPLIQYKTIDSHAAVTGIAQGAQALALLWEKWDDTALSSFGEGKGVRLHRDGASALWKDISIEAKKKARSYRLTRWLPCNQNDVPAYFDRDKKEQEKFMRHKLAMHIAKLSNDLNLGLPAMEIDTFEVAQTEREEAERIVFKTHKERPLIDCTFSARIRLPDYIGLGNHPAFGFGIVKSEE